MKNMNWLKKFSLAAAGIALTPQVAMASPEQVNLAKDFALASGHQNFMVLDKNDAEIIVFENGQQTLTSAAFLGSDRRDTIQPNLGATPAGSFNAVVTSITARGNFGRYESYIPYMCVPGRVTPARGKRPQSVSPPLCYSIHPTLQSPAETRALQSGNPAARFISHGCVRIVEYPRLAEAINRNQGNMLLIVLPHDESKTRQYLNIPASFKPEILPSP